MLSFIRNENSRSRLIYSDRAYAALVTEHLDEGLFLVGRPEGHSAIVVTQVDDGIVRVLAHYVKPASLGADGSHFLSNRHVQVLQETCSTLKTRVRRGWFVSADYRL